MSPDKVSLLVANDNRRPSWRRRVGLCIILALGTTFALFQHSAAIGFIFGV